MTFQVLAVGSKETVVIVIIYICDIVIPLKLKRRSLVLKIDPETAESKAKRIQNAP